MWILSNRQKLFAALFAVLCSSSCAKLDPFNVNVSTAEPIKVDLSMDVHVYQHGAAVGRTSAEETDYRTAMESRRNRMEEIQELKNQRLIGESHLGKIAIRNQPAGEFGTYVKETVAAENRDRDILMRHDADEKGTSLSKIREEQWRHWQRKSFPGEWIEVVDDDGSGFKWQQKQSAIE